MAIKGEVASARGSMRSGLVSEQAKEALTRWAPESNAVVAMGARDELTKTLSQLRGKDRKRVGDDQRTTAEEVAVRAGIAVATAPSAAEQRKIAEGLQRSLLTIPPEPDECEICVRYVPAAEAASVGGDWFDSFRQADGTTVLVIGDVMGHDMAAAAGMGQLRGLLRGIAWHGGAAPAEVLSGLDAAMQGLGVNTTASVVVGRLEHDSGDRASGSTQLRWSNAGHPPPLALHADGSVTALSGVETDLLLGIDPRTPRTESVAVLEQGCTVLLYTDGLIERRGHDLDEGLAQLRATLSEVAELPLEAMCDALLGRMLSTAVDDDVALVAVRLRGDARPDRSNDS